MPGFFSLNLSAISFFSASVSLSLSFTSTLSIGLRELSSSASPLSPEPEPSLIGGITEPVEPPVLPPVLDGVFALTFDVSVGVDALPASSFATALTSVPSFTLSAGIVMFPFSSTFRPLSAGTVHLPVCGSLVALTFTGSV